MTTKGAMNDFYNQFEEISKKLDKANDTIRNNGIRYFYATKGFTKRTEIS